MNRQQAVEISKRQKQYLQKHKIRSLFSQLVRQIVLHRPEDPIQYLINYLDKTSKRLLICLQGYNNQQRKRLALITSNKLNFKLIDISEMYRNCDYHLQKDDNINKKVLTELKKCETVYKGILISGYPNNLNQVQFIQKCEFLPDRYFRLPFDQATIQKQLKSQHSQNQIQQIIKRHQMEKCQLQQGLGEFLDVLPKNIDQASQRLTYALNMKISKKTLPYDSPRVIVIHPPYLSPPTLPQLVQTFIFHHINIPKSLTKLTKKQQFKNFVQKQIRKNKSLSKQIELALIQTQCKSAVAKTKGFVLSGWPHHKQNLVFLKERFILPHLILLFDLDQQRSVEQFEKLQQGDPEIFAVNKKPNMQQYKQQLVVYREMVEQLKQHYEIESFGWNQPWKQVLKSFESLINNPKIYS